MAFLFVLFIGEGKKSNPPPDLFRLRDICCCHIAKGKKKSQCLMEILHAEKNLSLPLPISLAYLLSTCLFFRTCATYCGWQQQQLHYVVYRTYVSPPYIEQTWVRAAGRRHREEGIKANRLLKGVEGGVGRAAALPTSLLINRITRYRTVVGGRGASWSVWMEEELFPFALSSPCSPLLSRSFPSQFVRSIPSALPSRPDAPNYI